MDGATTLDEAAAQRYIGSGGLPTGSEFLSQTLRGSGRFYFGNLAKGQHTLRVSIDDGRSFIATATFFVPYSRAEATSESKEMLVQLDIDIEGPDPTPTSCPLF